jgi:tetratricopeptide (TPR) repeat protein
MSGWVEMHDPAKAALWQRHSDRPYWSEFVPSDSTLFVSYRAVMSLDDLPNTTFWRNVFAMADSLPVKRLVLDIRENSGGNSFFNKQVIRGIIARPHLDRRDALFVITSGRTFSAAMNLAEDLEQWTNATFVGEPTGNAMVFFGDHTQIVLPVSGITVNVSTLPWYPADPKDSRPFIAPRLYAPLTSAAYRANVDPAMQAILKYSGATTSSSVEAAILRGDTASALQIVTDASRDPANRFRSPEADINTLGYRLLQSDHAAALAVFRINTRAFPNSPNAWDSYGEALLTDGKKDAAIAAYRKAVELRPGFPSSTEALQRLGIR